MMVMTDGSDEYEIRVLRLGSLMSIMGKRRTVFFWGLSGTFLHTVFGFSTCYATGKRESNTLTILLSTQ